MVSLLSGCVAGPALGSSRRQRKTRGKQRGRAETARPVSKSETFDLGSSLPPKWSGPFGRPECRFGEAGRQTTLGRSAIPWLHRNCGVVNEDAEGWSVVETQ